MSTQDTDEAGDVVEDVVEDLGQHGGEDERKKGEKSQEAILSIYLRSKYRLKLVSDRVRVTSVINCKSLRLTGHEEPLFSRVARDRFSGALNSALDRADFASASSSELLEGIPDLTAGLDSPLKRIIKCATRCCC